MEGNKRKQKGITLIALIITIIVMLILVGVTINVALNGRLFEQAQTAAEETQIEADREQLLSAVVGAIGTDAKVDFSKLDNNLPNGWTCSNGTYTSPKGNIFTVDEKGKITEGNKSGEENDKEEITKTLEYFGGTYTDGTQTIEMVVAIDYENKVMKFYRGNEGETLTFLTNVILTNVIINYDEQFYVFENGETIDIGTGATKLIREDGNYNTFIINGRLYSDVTKGSDNPEYSKLLPDFDITRLADE